MPARALVGAVSTWAVLRLLPERGGSVSLAGRAATAIGAALVVSSLTGVPAILAWVGALALSAVVADRIARRVLAAVVTLACLTALAGGWALVQAADDLDSGLAVASSLTGDVLLGADEMRTDLAAVSRHLDRAEAGLNQWWARPARVLPVFAHQFRLADTIIDDSQDIVDAAVPLGARDPDDAMVSGRIDLQYVAGASGELRLLADAALAAVSGLAEQDRRWLFGPAGDKYDQARSLLSDEAERLDAWAEHSAALLPHMGANGTKRWFVVVCTPAEARATCGFPGNWVEFDFDDGLLRLVDSGRMRELEEEASSAGLGFVGSPDMEANYGRFEPVPVLRNITMTPDFPAAADALANAIEGIGRTRPDVVAAVNTDGLAGLLRVTGAVDAGAMGQLNSQNARSRLDSEQYSRFETQRERTDALEEATTAVMDRIATLDSIDPRKLRRLSDPIERGGIIATVPGDPDNVFAAMGVDGALPTEPLAGVTVQNASANKLDAFRTVAMQLTPSSGQSEGCASVSITLNAVPADTPDYVRQNSVGLPAGWLKVWVSIYTPTPVTVATLDGNPLDFQVRSESGHPVISFFLDIGPGETHTIDTDLARGEADFPTILSQPSVLPHTVELTQSCPLQS